MEGKCRRLDQAYRGRRVLKTSRVTVALGFCQRVAALIASRAVVLCRSWAALLVGVAALVGSGGGVAWGQNLPSDITEMSLEELLQVDLTLLDVNVIGGHSHQARQWMVSYDFMYMEMEDYLTGTRRTSIQDVLDKYPVAPTRMSMQMDMSSVMYAPSDDLTLMAMFPYIKMEMDHVRRDGTRFTTRTEGIGDVSVRALYTVFRAHDALKDHDLFTALANNWACLTGTCPPDIKGDHHTVFLQGGVSFPTGSIEEDEDRDYNMQPGTGTYALLPGITYLGRTENWGWGVHGDATLRLGENERTYAFGDVYDATAWLTRKWTDWATSTVRIESLNWSKIRGMNPLVAVTSPARDPNRYGGDRIDLWVGLTLYQPKGKLKGNRLSFEFGTPLYQSLRDPQLETDWQLHGSWSWSFGPLEQKKM